VSKVFIIITPAPEYADDADPTGLTEEGWDLVMDALRGIAEDVDVRAE
jgi:hypothetical protein